MKIFTNVMFGCPIVIDGMTQSDLIHALTCPENKSCNANEHTGGGVGGGGDIIEFTILTKEDDSIHGLLFEIISGVLCDDYRTIYYNFKNYRRP